MKLLSTGIVGLDELLNGGVPEKHMIAVIGGMGTGKTTMALQFLMNGLMNGEKAVYMSLEEQEFEIKESAKRLWLGYSEVHRQRQLCPHPARP